MQGGIMQQIGIGPLGTEDEQQPQCFQLIPYAYRDGAWPVPDTLLGRLYQQMEADGTAQTVFYQGGVNNVPQFLEWAKNPMNFLTLVVAHYEKGSRAVAWGMLNNIGPGHALAHFCTFKWTWGTPINVAAGKEMLRWWWSMHRADGLPTFHVIVGMTPAIYRVAISFIKKLGFSLIGEIPDMWEIRGRRVGAVVSYIRRPPEASNG